MNGFPPRVAIVGCGHVGVREHLPGVRRAGGEVVALVDVVPGRAAELAAELGVPRAFTSTRSLLEVLRPDVIAVCAPSEHHHGIALQAVSAGCHLFIEKPPTLSGVQMSEVASAAEKAGLHVLAGSHHPYRANVRALRAAIEAGRLGEIYAVDCFKLRRAAVPRGPFEPGRPGGVAFYSSVHRIDVVLYLLGNPEVRSVTARTYGHFVDRWGVEAGVEDSLFAFIQFGNGCTLTLRDVHAAHLEEPNFMQCWFGDLSVLGTRGGARLHPLTYFETDPEGGQTAVQPGVSNDLHDGHAPAYARLFACIRGEGQLEGSPGRAISTMRLLEAVYASARQGGRQILPEP